MLPQQLRPERVYFEVTNYCNFDCSFCPSGQLERPRQHMNLALFKKGVDDIVRDRVTDRVGFHVLGEPLLYPHVYEAIAYAGERGLHTELSTNGSLLTDERVDRLQDAGLDALGISVQMLGAADHRSRGTAIPFDAYYDRVLGALKHIEQTGARMDVVLCYMNTSTERLFSIDRDMGLRWQPDKGRARLLFFVLDVYAALGMKVAREDVALRIQKVDMLRPKMLRLNQRTAIYVQPMMDWGNAFTTRKVYGAHMGYCGYCLSNVGILSNGEVTICCGDYNGRTSLGNLGEHALAELLLSKPAQDVREAMAHNKLVHPYCRRCLGSTNPAWTLVKGMGSVYLFRVMGFRPASVKEVPLMAA